MQINARNKHTNIQPKNCDTYRLQDFQCMLQDRHNIHLIVYIIILVHFFHAYQTTSKVVVLQTHHACNRWQYLFTWANLISDNAKYGTLSVWVQLHKETKSFNSFDSNTRPGLKSQVLSYEFKYSVVLEQTETQQTILAMCLSLSAVIGQFHRRILNIRKPWLISDCWNCRTGQKQTKWESWMV